MKYTKNLNKVVRGANALSVGISVVVAILIGVFLGVQTKKITGSNLGLVFWILIGIAAACLNIYRAYKDLNADMTELENDPKYKNYKAKNFDDDDDWDENSANLSDELDKNLVNLGDKTDENETNSQNLQNENLINSTFKNIKNFENSDK